MHVYLHICIHTYLHDHGIKDVLGSGVTFSHNLMSKVTQLNIHIESKKQTYDFKNIDNNNINVDVIWRNKIQLSDHVLLNVL